MYQAASLWLLIAMMLAWAVRRLWCGLVEPRLLNVFLLPGTIIAQVGFIVALLLGNATEAEVSLLGPSEHEPAEGKEKQKPPPELPLSVSVLAGLLPLVAVGAALMVVLTSWGGPLVQHVSPELVSPEIPRDLSTFWTQARGLLSLSEQTLSAMGQLDWGHWPTWVFAYVLICLCLWLAPIHGNTRGHVYAVAALGAAAALAGTVLPGMPDLVRGSWPILTVVVGVLFGLLLGSLALRGALVVVREVSR
ncbi:MAG: hypothetical protein U1A27_09940 [Phycisphaerae bacterium]